MPQFPFTPSHLPTHASQGHVRKLEQALKTGDPNGVDIAGNSALHVLMGMKPGQTATMIGMLVAAGADPNQRNEQGETPP